VEHFTNTPIHTDIVVKDLDSSVRFYTEVLGYTVFENSVVEGPVVSFLSDSTATKMQLVFLTRNKRSTMLELIYFIDGPKEAFESSRKNMRNLSLSFLVENIDKAVEFFKNKGIVPVSDVFQISLAALGETKIIFFQDPDGYLIEVVAPA
jgi:catechol 2,3-dioxygenase-like lactoylglutathione lyase family enzyme